MTGVRVSAAASPRRRGAAARAEALPRATVTVQYAVTRKGLPAAASVRRYVAAATEREATVTVRFAGAREGRTLNAVFRGKDYATNVLTFVYDDGGMRGGDLVLCVPVVRREARSQGKSVIAHCAHLLIHGMLHLQGYDHERDADAACMERRETALLAALGFADPYTLPS